MKYRLSFVCVSPDGKHHEEQNYDVTFERCGFDYGNGMGMFCKNLKAGYANYNFDIRYDKDYHPDRQIQFILNWALNNWSGDDGSWKITFIQCTEVEK